MADSSVVDQIVQEILRHRAIIEASPHGKVEATYQDGYVIGITPSPHFRRKKPEAPIPQKRSA